MKKKTVLIFVSVLILSVMAGCGGGRDVDVKGLADALLTQITYQDELSAIDLDTAQMFYNFGDAVITEAVFYESSGATAEEIAVIKCDSDKDAQIVETALNTRVAEQKESYTDYVPAELEKLNAAVVYKSGNTAVLSVSNDPDNARKIIDS